MARKPVNEPGAIWRAVRMVCPACHTARRKSGLLISPLQLNLAALPVCLAVTDNYVRYYIYRSWACRSRSFDIVVREQAKLSE